jgi:hypothetical protein
MFGSYHILNKFRAMEAHSYASKKLTCKICNQICVNFYEFGTHIRNAHNLTSKKYYNTYLKTEDENICERYTCNTKTKFRSILDGYIRFCSTSCRNKVLRANKIVTYQSKIKHSKSMKIKWKSDKRKAKYTIFICLNCNEKFKANIISKRKFCGNSCSMSYLQKTNKLKNGYKQGKYYSKKNKVYLHYNSSYELRVYKLLENMSHIKSYQRCNFTIDYIINKKKRKYNPDLFIEYLCDQNEILEVKASWALKDLAVIAKHKAAEQYAKQNDFKFTVWTEQQIKEHENA